MHPGREARQGPLRIFAGNTQFAHQGIQGRTRHTEPGRRLADHAPTLLQCPNHVFALHLFQCAAAALLRDVRPYFRQRYPKKSLIIWFFAEEPLILLKISFFIETRFGDLFIPCVKNIQIFQ